MLGQIQLFPYDFAPRGWPLCDGHELPVFQNQELFKLLGKTFGGDGQRTFALPNLMSVAPRNCNFCISLEGSSTQSHYEGVLGETFLLPTPSTSANNLLDCAGQALDMGDYSSLYQYMRDKFGGEGITFNLPKLTGDAINGYRYVITVEGEYPDIIGRREPFVGEVILLPFNEQFPNLQPCTGAKLKVQENRDLYDVIGTRFGGQDPYFAVPNLSAAAPMGYNYYIAKRGPRPTRP